MGREACVKVQRLNERTIWIVRIAGLAVILLLLFLLMSLYSRLVRLQQQNPSPKSSTSRLDAPQCVPETVWEPHA